MDIAWYEEMIEDCDHDIEFAKKQIAWWKKYKAEAEKRKTEKLEWLKDAKEYAKEYVKE